MSKYQFPKTELCDVLGIEYPIIAGAMAHISDGRFAAAVSEAGGLGVIASTLNGPEWIEEQVNIARSLTDKPVAVNLIMESRIVEDCARKCVELKVPICTISAGKPDDIVPILVEGGVKVICLIPHVRAAQKMEALGATAVIAEGTEGGGHIGRLQTMPMVRQVAEAVNIPVIAAGGIADGKGFLAALALGAVGVQMGTVFLASDECPISDAYKQAIVDAKDSDVDITGKRNRKQVRCLKNGFWKKYWELHDSDAPQAELTALTAGSIDRAVQGDVETGCVSCGSIAGLVKEVRPVAQIIQDIMQDASDSYAKFKELYG
jgi:enoyl-[acyl-carrier protein] reductase II